MRVELVREVTTAERAVIEVPRVDVEAWVSDYLGAPWTFPDAISHEDHDLIEDAVDELVADRIGSLRWVSDGAREDVSSHRLSAIDDQEV